MPDNIKVIIRKRPILYKSKDVVKIKDSVLIVSERKKTVDLTPIIKTHTFCYDKIYDEFSVNRHIYNINIKDKMIKSKNFICYAYGQTGSGKTHTIFGDKVDVGILSMTMQDIMELYKEYDVYMSSYEIYNNEAYDLLNKKTKLYIREGYHGELHINSSKHKLKNYYAFMDKMDIIKKMRNVGLSSQNNKSSRSHAIFVIYIRKGMLLHKKITFVDLAGSERGSKSICKNKMEYKENAEINKSLLALKECIRSMGNHKKHIPFRSSKLTTILKESFDSKTDSLMIGTISPEELNIVDTLNTLLYTSSVKLLKKFSTIKKSLLIPIKKKTISYEEYYGKYHDKLLKLKSIIDDGINNSKNYKSKTDLDKHKKKYKNDMYKYLNLI